MGQPHSRRALGTSTVTPTQMPFAHVLNPTFVRAVGVAPGHPTDVESGCEGAQPTGPRARSRASERQDSPDPVSDRPSLRLLPLPLAVGLRSALWTTPSSSASITR
jgi:hypothetical protein